MENNEHAITLIVADNAEGLRSRGDLSFNDTFIQRVVAKTLDFSKARENFKKCMEGINELLRDVKNEAVQGWEMDSISVSLAINAEGSIGIATAGVKASFEISFKRAANKAETTS